jgi:hypothetical protein
VSQQTTRKTLAALMSSGARLTEVETNGEAVLPPQDRAPDPDAPPFALDDLIDLHLLLEGEIGLGDVLRG